MSLFKRILLISSGIKSFCSMMAHDINSVDNIIFVNSEDEISSLEKRYIRKILEYVSTMYNKNYIEKMSFINSDSLNVLNNIPTEMRDMYKRSAIVNTVLKHFKYPNNLQIIFGSGPNRGSMLNEFPIEFDFYIRSNNKCSNPCITDARLGDVSVVLEVLMKKLKLDIGKISEMTFSCSSPENGTECHSCHKCFERNVLLYKFKLLKPFYNKKIMDWYSDNLKVFSSTTQEDVIKYLKRLSLNHTARSL